jgi:hypothetical protein
MHTKNGQTFRLLEDFNLKHGLSHCDFHTEFVSFYLPPIALLKDPATPPKVTSQDCIAYENIVNVEDVDKFLDKHMKRQTII